MTKISDLHRCWRQDADYAARWIPRVLIAVLFVGATLTAQTGSAQQPPATSDAPVAAHPARDEPWPPAGVFRVSDGVNAPRVVKEVKPNYPADARKKKIQGIVWLEAVVKADGTVGEVRVTTSIGRQFGFDDAAIESVKRWRFKPGMKDGAAVPVLVEIEMSFTLK